MPTYACMHFFVSPHRTHNPQKSPRLVPCLLVPSRPDLYKLWLLDTEEDRPEYLGCYIDDKDDRVLTNAITTEDMTWAICRDHCADKDALYFATQVSFLVLYSM